MNYPERLNPNIEVKKDIELERYGRIGNSYRFNDREFLILKSGNKYKIDFLSVGKETKIETNTRRNHNLDEYVLNCEYYRLLNEGISLSHFSNFSDGDNAYVLTGPPNTGKTGINLALNLQGFKFMADEDAPVTEKGVAFPFAMPLSIGNQNIEEFQDLLNDLDAEYSKVKAKAFKEVRRLPIPLIGKALDRFVEPVKVDPKKLDFEKREKKIRKAFYIQPEKREDIELEKMDKQEFCRKMALWNNMQRSNLESIYRIWQTENDKTNENIEESKNKDKEILEKCFADVEVKKLKVPLKRQPRKIADFIEEKL